MQKLKLTMHRKNWIKYNMVKVRIVVLVITFITQGILSNLFANSECENIGELPHIFINGIKYIHVVQEDLMPLEGSISRGQTIGVVQEIPKKNTHNPVAYQEGITFYEKGDHVQSLGKFLELYLEEPKNLFLNYWLGKVYYAMGRKERSFYFYNELMNLILEKAQIEKNNKTEIIDMWFLEAYWKIGTIYLDKKMYKEAILNIRKFFDFYLVQTNKPPYGDALINQAFTYLTEAAYYGNDYEQNRYFYCKAKEYNPQNKNVDVYKLNIKNESSP